MFTVIIILGCTAVLALEFRANADGIDFETANETTEECYYRASVFGQSFCAASLEHNPMFGPSAGTLMRFGAVNGHQVVEWKEYWRLFMAVVMHSGAIQLGVNTLTLIFLAASLERTHGMVRCAFIFLFAGVFGNIAAALLSPDVLSVGASGAVFGLIGASVVDTAVNCDMNRRPCLRVVFLFFGILLQVFMGTMPMMDNFTHLAGLFMGVISSIALLDKFSNVSNCLATASRGCCRTVSAGAVLFLFILSVGLLYNIGGLEIYDVCPGCQEFSCKDFPWGCQEPDCWWDCDVARVPRPTCAGEAVWPKKRSNIGYVNLTCPPTAQNFTDGLNSTSVTVDDVDLKYWNNGMLVDLCESNCPPV